MLQRDGRATQLEISRAVGLSQPAVAERIRKLEERGVITGYTARVDATKLGKDITAFIGVSIEHPKYFEGFARKGRFSDTMRHIPVQVVLAPHVALLGAAACVREMR